jgi:hypothetical protein
MWSHEEILIIEDFKNYLTKALFNCTEVRQNIVYHYCIVFSFQSAKGKIDINEKF